MNEVISSGEPFTDPEFPPTPESIALPGDPNPAREYEWKRASEIFPGGHVVFNEDIDPNDINQGELGNCYWLAVLSAYAEVAGRVQQRFKV